MFEKLIEKIKLYNGYDGYDYSQSKMYKYSSFNNAADCYKLICVRDNVDSETSFTKAEFYVGNDDEVKIAKNHPHLYNLLNIAWADASKCLYIVDDENCVDAFAKNGKVATCYFDSITDGTKIILEEIERNVTRKFSRIVVVADNDVYGKMLVEKWQKSGVYVSEYKCLAECEAECTVKDNSSEIIDGSHELYVDTECKDSCSVTSIDKARSYNEIVDDALQYYADANIEDTREARDKFSKNDKLLKALVNCDVIKKDNLKDVLVQKNIISKTLFAELINQKKKEIKVAKKQAKIDRNSEVSYFEVNGVEYIQPDNFIIKNGGIYYKRLVNDDVIEENISATAIVLVREFKGVSDKFIKYELVRYVNESWKTVGIFGAEKLKDSKVIVQTLAPYGLDVASTNAKLLVEYLRQFINANDNIIKKSISVNHVGWQDKKFLLPPDGTDVYFDIPDSDLKKNIAAKGDFEEWKTNVNELRGKYPVLRLFVDAALAAPLVRLLNFDNYILLLWGRGGCGKSSIFSLAGSVWGNAGFVRCCNSTANALEGQAASFNTLPYILDEDENCSANVSQIVYALYNGRGKGRLNADSSVKKAYEWNTITMINGENPVLSDYSKAGEYRRLIEIHISDGEAISEDDKCLIRDMKNNNYGHAGRLFAEKVNANYSDVKELVKKVSKTVTEFLKNTDGNSKHNTHLYALGLLAAADVLFDVLVNNVEDIDSSIENAKLFIQQFYAGLTDVNYIDDVARAYDYILDWVNANSRNFCEFSDYKNKDDRKNYDGFYLDGYVYINPTVFNRILVGDDKSKILFNPARMKKEFVARGISLMLTNGSKVVNVGGRSERFVPLKLK